MAANLLASVHFYCRIRSLPNYVVLSRRTRTSRRKKSVVDNIYIPGASHCAVSLSKTHLSLFKYWFNPGRPVPIYLKNC